MALAVYVTEIGGSMQTLRFSRSPVRIGRNQLNDITLEDQFVSEWHGAIRFDDHNITYSDMGSTNGSVLDGTRLPKNISAPLSDLSRLVLGRRELMVARVADRADELLRTPPPSGGFAAPVAPTSVSSPSASSPIGAPGFQGPSGDTPVSKTVGWGEPIPALPKASLGRAGVAAADTGPGDGPHRTRFGLADEAKVIVQQVTPVPGSPNVSRANDSARRPSPLVDEPPRAPAPEPSVRAQAPSLPSSASASAVDEAKLARQHKLLEAFAEAFVGLRKGYEQFGSEVGVRTVNGTTPLHRARTSQEVLAHMLSPKVDAGAVARDMIGIFADFGIHHIAMMEGITQGVRSVLQSLDPRANELEVGGRLFSGAKQKARWSEYLERFEQLITDDEQLHIAIFGEEFAHAYASVTLGGGNKPPRGGGP